MEMTSQARDWGFHVAVAVKNSFEVDVAVAIENSFEVHVAVSGGSR